MIMFLRRLLFGGGVSSPAVLPPAKDPMDWSHTPVNSSAWFTDTYCFQCKAWTDHASRMADICHTCGAHGDMHRYRSSRRIWDGAKWLVQHKYGNGPTDYSLNRES